MNLQYQKRVLNEREELDGRIKKLSTFMHEDVYPTLSATEQGLLMVQLAAMEQYKNALNRRVELFGN